MPKARRLIVISDCTRECPFAVQFHTPGTGSGTDYFCRKTVDPGEGFRKIVGYVEWRHELPEHGTFPKWCPLQEAEEGMYVEPQPEAKAP